MRPLLTEPGVKYFLSETLSKCKEYKTIYYNNLFNIGVCILFFLCLGLMLLYKYKGRLTPSEKAIKEREKQQYILSTIKNYQSAKKISQEALITGLPSWENL